MKITIETEEHDVARLCAMVEIAAAHDGDKNIRLLDRIADLAERLYLVFQDKMPSPGPGEN